jgi:hypothetical protein
MVQAETMRPKSWTISGEFLEGDEASPVFDVRHASRGAIYVAEFDEVVLTIQVCDTEDGIFQAWKTPAGSSWSLTLGEMTTYQLPDDVFKFPYIRLGINPEYEARSDGRYVLTLKS